MEVFVHLPSNQETYTELEKQIAAILAQAILDHVKRQKCPTAQKLELIRAVQACLQQDNT